MMQHPQGLQFLRFTVYVGLLDLMNSKTHQTHHRLASDSCARRRTVALAGWSSLATDCNSTGLQLGKVEAERGRAL